MGNAPYSVKTSPQLVEKPRPCHSRKGPGLSRTLRLHRPWGLESGDTEGGSGSLEFPVRRGRPVTLHDLGQGPFFPSNPAPGALGCTGRRGPLNISFPSGHPARVPRALPGPEAQWRRCGDDRGSPRAYLEAAATDGTRTELLAAPLLPPRRSPPVLALAQPPHTGPGRSRLRSPRAPVFRAGPGAPPPKPPKPSPGCWPRDGTRTSASPAPQEARARGTGGLCRECSPGARLAGRRRVRADT